MILLLLLLPHFPDKVELLFLGKFFYYTAKINIRVAWFIFWQFQAFQTIGDNKVRVREKRKENQFDIK